MSPSSPTPPEKNQPEQLAPTKPAPIESAQKIQPPQQQDSPQKTSPAPTSAPTSSNAPAKNNSSSDNNTTPLMPAPSSPTSTAPGASQPAAPAQTTTAPAAPAPAATAPAATATPSSSSTSGGASAASATASSATSSTICQNCQTSTTPLWRRDESGQILCNACGLFLKLHGRPRPISLKTNVIKSRNRTRNNTAHSNKRNVHAKSTNSPLHMANSPSFAAISPHLLPHGSPLMTGIHGHGPIPGLSPGLYQPSGGPGAAGSAAMLSHHQHHPYSTGSPALRAAPGVHPDMMPVDHLQMSLAAGSPPMGPDHYPGPYHHPISSPYLHPHHHPMAYQQQQLQGPLPPGPPPSMAGPGAGNYHGTGSPMLHPSSGYSGHHSALSQRAGGVSGPSNTSSSTPSTPSTFFADAPKNNPASRAATDKRVMQYNPTLPALSVMSSLSTTKLSTPSASTNGGRSKSSTPKFPGISPNPKLPALSSLTAAAGIDMKPGSSISHNNNNNNSGNSKEQGLMAAAFSSSSAPPILTPQSRPQSPSMSVPPTSASVYGLKESSSFIQQSPGSASSGGALSEHLRSRTSPGEDQIDKIPSLRHIMADWSENGSNSNSSSSNNINNNNNNSSAFNANINNNGNNNNALGRPSGLPPLPSHVENGSTSRVSSCGRVPEDYSALKSRVTELELVNDLLSSRVKQLEASESRIRDSEMALRTRVAQLEDMLRSYEYDKERERVAKLESSLREKDRELEKRRLFENNTTRPNRVRSLSPPRRVSQGRESASGLEPEDLKPADQNVASESWSGKEASSSGLPSASNGPTTSMWYASIAATANANGNGMGGFASPSFGPLGMTRGVGAPRSATLSGTVNVNGGQNNNSGRNSGSNYTRFPKRNGTMVVPSPVFTPLNGLHRVSDDNDVKSLPNLTDIEKRLEGSSTAAAEKRASTVSPQISPLMSKAVPVLSGGQKRSSSNMLSEEEDKLEGAKHTRKSPMTSFNKISDILSPADSNSSTIKSTNPTVEEDYQKPGDNASKDEDESQARSTRKKIRLSSIVQ